MRYLLLILILFFNLPAFSQTISPLTKPTISPLNKEEPQYYIDSVRVQRLEIFDPEKIESINVVKNTDSASPNGKVYIKIKETERLDLLTVGDIKRINHIPSGSTALFMLDNEIIKDTTNFRIDSLYILKVETVKASEIVYLPGNISNFEILKIITATKSNIERENRVLIRGR
ncbi:MAG TPA: hypothetical protein VK772_16245 [Puia sp.]|jgi:hypothetical protein|nr:hypothetical protein [Puia sp.]